MPETTEELTVEQRIEAAVSRAIEANQPKEKTRETVQVTPEDTVSVGADIISPWERDAGNYINALVMHKRGNRSKAQAILNEVRRSRKEAPGKQLQAEVNEARAIIARSSISDLAKKRAVQSIGVAADGGNLLPKPFFAELFVRIEEVGVARRFFRGIPMPSDSLDLKSVLAKPVVGWNGELNPISTTKATSTETPLVAKKLAAIVPWSLEFQEDEVFGFLPIITQLLAEAVASAEDKAGFNGAGAGDTANGEFTGLLNLAGNAVHDIASRDSATVNFDDISFAVHKLTLAAKNSGVWFAHPTFEGVFERIKDKEDNYIYKNPGADIAIARLWRYPVQYVQEMPSVEDVSEGDETPFMVFGNPSNMFFGTRTGLSLDVSTEGTIRAGDDSVDLSAFQDDAALLRVKERIGFQSVLQNSFVSIRTAEDTE